MSRLGWAGMLRLGLVQLRLTPAEFWALTPAELALMAGMNLQTGMTRSAFETLLARFPDEQARDG